MWAGPYIRGMEDFSTEAARRRVIAWATAVTRGTPLALQADEAAWLELYARGELALDDVLAGLAGRVHHVLYCSRAVRPFTDGQLADMLDRSRAFNAQHGITGLMVHCAAEHFVQLIEGDALAVHGLFARIRRDPRHQRVTVLSHGASKARCFPNWHMACAAAEFARFHRLRSCLKARHRRAQAPIEDAHLRTLLNAFGGV